MVSRIFQMKVVMIIYTFSYRRIPFLPYLFTVPQVLGIRNLLKDPSTLAQNRTSIGLYPKLYASLDVSAQWAGSTVTQGCSASRE